MAEPTTDPRPTADLDAVVQVLNDIRARLAPTPELLTRDTFAELLDIGTSTFDRLRETGAVGPRPVRLGGALRWERREVLAWLARRDHRGELLDASSWPAVWADMQRRAAGK